MKWKISIFPFLLQKDNKTALNFLRTNGYYPSTTECSMVINTDNIVEKPSSFDCSFDFKKTENEDEIIFEIFKDNNNIGSCFVSIFETCGCIHNVEINEAFHWQWLQQTSFTIFFI